MRPLVRGLAAGGCLGVLAGLAHATAQIFQERYLAHGLRWLAFEQLLRGSASALFLGALAGGVSSLPLLAIFHRGRGAPPAAVRLALAVACVSFGAALLAIALENDDWARYWAQTSVSAKCVHGAGAFLAAAAGAWLVVRCALRESFPVVPALALLGIVLVGGVAAPKLAPRPDGPNLLLISVDTLRADRLGCYGYANAHTSALDALASEGMLWETVVASAPVTLTAVSTLMTGLDPSRHGAHYNGFYRLRSEPLTLAEVLANHGYRTAAVVANFALDRSFRIDQGFRSFDDRMTQRLDEDPDQRPGSARAERQGQPSWWSRTLESRPAQKLAREVTDAGIAWLERNADDRFFLWLHYMDPHKPYAPPEEFLRGAPPYADSYDAEVAYVDSQIGRLLAEYKRRFPAADTLVAFTADHGESLGEHGLTGHVKVLYEQALRIPFILRRPGRIEAGARRIEPLRGRDVAREILDALGVEPPASFGQADRPEDGARWWTWAESYHPRIARGEAPIYALRSERWKLIHQAGGSAELYDLTADPAETRNVAGEQAGDVSQLRALLEREIGGEEEAPLSVDSATFETLKALGYVDG